MLKKNIEEFSVQISNGRISSFLGAMAGCVQLKLICLLVSEEGVAGGSGVIKLGRTRLGSYGLGLVAASCLTYVHTNTILLLVLDDFIIFELEIANKSKDGVLKYEILVSLALNSTGERNFFGKSPHT